jgi:Tfp pilus assembly protein PilV
MECWRNGPDPSLHYSITPPLRRSRYGFALYEVLLGVTVFVIGVVALGRSVENCLTASTLSAEDSRVRLVLANRMAEIQANPGVPDSAKENKVDTGYGMVKLIQKVVPAQLTEEDGVELTGISLVTLKAEWDRGGVTQSESIQFYVYRSG